MQKVNELKLDHDFWRAVSTDATFRLWFLSKSKFTGRDLELVTGEKWHQRWYRDPDTKKDSETDILLIFQDRASGERIAIHIENKPDHRVWEGNQPENYRKRALNRMPAWKYVDFQIVLIAPRSFIARSQIEVSHFDFALAYEDIGEFVAEFKIA